MKFKEFFKDDFSVNWEKIDGLSWFEKLKTTPQSTIWHKEGNVSIHVHNVVSSMEKVLEQYGVVKGTNEWIMCMMAAICHDLGKADTTKWSDEDNDYKTKNHGVVGERITRNLFYDEDIVMREKVCYMVRHHMTLHHVLDDDTKTDKRLIKLSHGIVPIRYMLYLNVADSLGSINDIETKESIKDKFMKISSICVINDYYDKPYSSVNKSQLIRNFINYNSKLENENNDFCVYIMCGFPGCGKSTYIENNLSDKTIISRDIIRCQLGINGATVENNKKVIGTKEEEKKVSEIFDKKMIECCKNKESFVIDNTNLKYQYRKDYLLKIMKYNPLIRIIYVEAPDFINTCRQRREGEISKTVYKYMNSNFDFPQLYECDELIIIKQHFNKEEEKITFKSNYYNNKIDFLNDLKITRGAMILDGYECYDSCIKYMDELIKKYEN